MTAPPLAGTRPADVPLPRPRPIVHDPHYPAAAHLPCALCGRELHDHGGAPPDCRAFVRPMLPAGFVYASALRTGAEFQFLGRGTGRAHVTQQDAHWLDDENGLVELRTATTAYLVEGTTIVRLAPAGRRAGPATAPPERHAPRHRLGRRQDQTLRYVPWKT